MEHSEETRPSMHLNSFNSSTFRSYVFDPLPEDPKKQFRKHLKFQTPLKELLTSRGFNFLTPRTQISSFSGTQERELASIGENFSKIRDDYKSVESAYNTTVDEEFKDFPTLKWCAHCSKEVCTEIAYKNTAKTFWSSVGLLLMGGVCGCFMLPYMMDSCKEVVARCSKCKRDLGSNQADL